ncbi:hypothetical protein [Arthrobacter sp. NPDC090010]|uniref:hypothetical protein n=1 Tax=Arthrobacter sp. NPDC090010 TaxID=3363942 RepID=UPI00380B3C4C
MGNMAYDGGGAGQAPVIPGLHPETQELLARRYGRPDNRYGRRPAVRYPVKTFVIGWLVSYGTLLALLLILWFFWSVAPPEALSPGQAPSATALLGSSLMMLVYIPLFAAFPALFVGVPAALGVVFALRNVRNQWWHILGFAVAGFLTPAPMTLLAAVGGGGDSFGTGVLFGSAGALCAVVGRLAIWKLVEVTPPAAPVPWPPPAEQAVEK